MDKYGGNKDIVLNRHRCPQTRFTARTYTLYSNTAGY